MPTTVRGEESDDTEREDVGSTHRRRDRDGETGVAQAFRPAIARLKPCATTRSVARPQAFYQDPLGFTVAMEPLDRRR